MVDPQYKLINKCVDTGKIESVIAKGITEEHFTDPECQKIWKYVKDYTVNYRTSPDPQTVKQEFPDFDWEVVTDPVDFLLDQFVTSVKRRRAVEVFNELAEIIDEDDYKKISVIDEIFVDHALELAQTIPSTNIDRFSNMRSRIESYKVKRDKGITAGMSFGIPALDEDTYGLQKHQYVTLAGWTGIGKSWMGLYFAIQHYLEGYTPMIVSLEMDADEVYGRVDAIAVGLKQSYLKNMTLSGNDIKKWEKYAEKVEKASNDIIVIDVESVTPEKIYAETARWKPDVVIVDYVQLMEGPKHLKAKWERVDYCSMKLKQQARGMKIPVYGLAQTNAEGSSDGAKLENTGGSKAIGFHSDLYLGLYQDEDMKDIKKLQMTVEKNRGGPTGRKIDLKFDLENSEIRPWNGKVDAYPEI